LSIIEKQIRIIVLVDGSILVEMCKIFGFLEVVYVDIAINTLVFWVTFLVTRNLIRKGALFVILDILTMFCEITIHAYTLSIDIIILKVFVLFGLIKIIIYRGKWV
jgi:hypothetical protein